MLSISIHSSLPLLSLLLFLCYLCCYWRCTSSTQPGKLAHTALSIEPPSTMILKAPEIQDVCIANSILTATSSYPPSCGLIVHYSGQNLFPHPNEILANMTQADLTCVCVVQRGFLRLCYIPRVLYPDSCQSEGDERQVEQTWAQSAA